MIIDKLKKVNEKETVRVRNEKASDRMIGKWVKCDKCKEIIYKEDLHDNLSVCPNCGKHFRLSARRRIKQIADEETFEEIGADILTKDPLNFEGYLKKVKEIKEKTKIEEAVKCGTCEIEGQKVVLGVMDRKFPYGKHGVSSRRKNNSSNRNSNKRKITTYNVLCIRWSKNARRNCIINANGKNIKCNS